VIGLRERGFEVSTYSVRRAGVDHDVDAEVVDEKNRTRVILPFRPLDLLLVNLRTLLAQPADYLSTLALAMSTCRPGFRGLLLQIAYFHEALLLAGMLRQDGAEHLHNHFGDNSGTVAMLAAKLARIPFSITIHGPHIFFEAPHWALARKTERSSFIATIGHFCTSQMMLNSAKEHWEKFEIVRCGVDPTKLEYVAPSRAATELVYVGRLSVEKGLPVLFDSISQLLARGVNVSLAVLGDGPDREFLENLAATMGISDRVHFKGFVDQATIVTTLRASDVFVLPSFAEGIPVALMEAMAIGTPVIATYVGGIPELVVHGETGQLVYPSDASALADAIDRYASDLAYCKRISRQARSKVEAEYDIEDQVDKLAMLFGKSAL
jgi:glycosyltransferase involved in cell wall biosynthesis